MHVWLGLLFVRRFALDDLTLTSSELLSELTPRERQISLLVVRGLNGRYLLFAILPLALILVLLPHSLNRGIHRLPT